MVATAVFETKYWGDEGEVVGRAKHTMGYELDDATGQRRTRLLTSSDRSGVQWHHGVQVSIPLWEVHGLLPDFANRVRDMPDLKVVPLTPAA